METPQDENELERLESSPDSVNLSEKKEPENMGKLLVSLVFFGGLLLAYFYLKENGGLVFFFRKKRNFC